jgi:SpoVK/Ycf46/Vps4 family AAA+-type ATPase
MVWWPWRKAKPVPRKLRKPIECHLGVDLAEAQSVTHEMKPVQRVNIQRVVDRWAAEATPAVEAFGFATSGYFGDDGLARYLITDELIQAPVERAQLDSGPDETLDCVHRGLFLLHREKAPVVVAFRPPRFTSDLPVLEVIAPTREAARATLTAVLEEAQRGSVYKGRTISLDPPNSWREGVSIRFHQVRPTPREDIVLPDELIQVVERNVLGMLKHAQLLRSAGRSLRRGLLFHGPPGTGKTMLVRYLTQACNDHTILLMTGSQQGLVREACQIARMLAPSIVVLEDVDLVAEDREHNRCPAVLHELLNEMDGLGPREEVAFLLTTNRPDILEPALSARPGRIDQAIAFPLPDEPCRRRLYEVYGRGLDLSALDLERWVGQTNGVSPAFIEELLRKATLMAAERGEANQPMRLTDTDIQNAIRELIYFGGELTQKLLGYRPGRIGYLPTPGR